MAQEPCLPNDLNRSKDVVINVLTGDQESGPSRFKKSDHTRIVFYNLNPFAFEYQMDVKGTAIEEPALSTFLPILGGVISSLGGDSATATKATAAAGSAAAAHLSPGAAMVAPAGDRGSCTAPDQTQLTQMEIRDNDLFVARQKLAAEVTRFEAIYRSASEAYARIPGQLKTPALVCPALPKLARELHDVVVGYQAALSNVLDLGNRLKDLADIQASALARVAAQLTPGCGQSTLDHLTAEVEAAKTAADALDARLKPLRADEDKLATARRSTETVLNDPHAYHIEKFAGPVDTPTDFKITTSRRAPESTAKFAVVGEDPKINFGGQARFSIGAGMSFTPLTKVDYVRVQGALQPSDLPNNLMSLIGTKERSSSRVMPIALLHARVTEWNSFIDGLHLSLGVTAKNDKQGTDVEYLLGPSLSMLEHRLFLTVGSYAGKKQALEGNLYPGAAVPSSLAEIPVRKDWRWSIGFAISYAFTIKTK